MKKKEGVYRAPDDIKAMAGFVMLKEVKSFADFKKWFVNVYWYHYRWQTLGIICALAVIAGMIHSIASRVDPDAAMMIVSNYELYTPGAESLCAEIEGAAVADNNGDGVSVLELQTFTVDNNNEYGMAQRMAMNAMLTRGDMLLVIMDESELKAFEPETFLTLDRVGLPGERTVSVQDSPKLAELYINEESRMTAAVINRADAPPGHVDTAFAILEYLLS